MLLLTLFVFSTSCKNETQKQEEEVEDEYAEFKVKPDYILHPTKAQKEYFDAYDRTLQKWGVDYEELFVTTSKGIAHIIMCGPQHGIPVVLLHGMTASSSMWYPNAEALSKNYRLFAVDLIIEPGKSYKTADFENLEEATEWYQEILWALKLDSFHLIGSSRGGWLATDLALNAKRDVRSLILLSPAQTLMWIPPSTGLVKNILNVFHSKEKRVDRTVETMSTDPDNIDTDYMEQYRVAQENDTVKKFMMQMKPFPKKELKKLKMPVYVLIGDDDMFNNKRTLHVTKKYIPNGHAEVIPNSGHFLSVDQAEKVNQKMLGFLERVDRNRSDVKDI